MARPTPGRAQFHYLESWLLPDLGIRVNIFHWNPGHERDQDFYVDIGEISGDGDVWHTVDHYLDLVVHTGQRTELIDVDELFAAHKAGLITDITAERAVNIAVATVAGLAEHGHDLHAWLTSNGIDLLWR